MNGQQVTIVMIEDDDGHARLIEKNVRRAGVCNDIVHHTDGTSALAYLFDDAVRCEGPMLVLLDLNLPDMSGVSILEKIKKDECLRLAPVIVLTTTDDPREVERCYQLGCSVYITKPVKYEEFVEALTRLGMFLEIVKVPRAAPGSPHLP